MRYGPRSKRPGRPASTWAATRLHEASLPCLPPWLGEGHRTGGARGRGGSAATARHGEPWPMPRGAWDALARPLALQPQLVARGGEEPRERGGGGGREREGARGRRRRGRVGVRGRGVPVAPPGEGDRVVDQGQGAGRRRVRAAAHGRLEAGAAQTRAGLAKTEIWT